MNVSAQHSSGLKIPFDHKRLDRLMDQAGIDVVVATSKHNVQYLLGGHRANFFDYMDATGVTRYLPVLVYPKGAPEKAAYFGHRLEKFQTQNNPLWTPETQTNTAGSVDAMQKAVDYIRKASLKTKRIAAEFGFLPYDASIVLRGAFPDADWVDALFVLERQRVKKSADELAKLKVASEAVLASMQAVIANHGPGATKAEVVEALRREETNRGLTFEYCLITCGTSMNRAPSDQKWEKGDIMSIDSRRELSWLYRRHLPYGDPGRARCRIERSAGGNRKHPARGDEADKGRRLGLRNLRRRRTAGFKIEAPQSSRLPGARHGAG